MPSDRQISHLSATRWTSEGTANLGTRGSTEQKGPVRSFLKIDGIQGDATADGHKKEIELIGWHFGDVKSNGFGISGPGGGAGKIQANDFVFTMHADTAAPKLFEAMATGKYIPKAVLSVRKAGGSTVDFLKIDLEKILVSGLHTTGNGPLPAIEVALNFARVEFEFKAQTADDTAGGSMLPKTALFSIPSHKETEAVSVLRISPLFDLWRKRSSLLNWFTRGMLSVHSLFPVKRTWPLRRFYRHSSSAAESLSKDINRVAHLSVRSEIFERICSEAFR